MDGIPRQGTPEWHRARSGKITASRFGDISRNRKGDGWGDGAYTYAYELVGERLLLDNPEWKPPKEPSIYALEWGKDNEPFARSAYIFETTNNVAEFGFIVHPEHKAIGASLDGVVVDQNGSIEIKCPVTTKEHVRTMFTKQVPKQYVPQVQGGLWVSGFEWCDFVSFDNRVHSDLTTCIVRVERDESYIEKLAAKVTAFASFVDEIEGRVRSERQAA